MSRILRLFTAIATAGALAAAAGAAQAQPQGPAGAQQQQPDLPSLLHLRPDQQRAFQAYQVGTRPRPEEVSRMRATSGQSLAGLPTPQRLDRIAGVLQLQMQMFQRNADATRAFYEQLSPDQQRTFDQVTAPPSGRGRPQG